jgi:YidC/Oxa1 family membrane protein insertase
MPLAGLLQPIEDVLTDLLEWLGPGSIGMTWGWAIVVLTILVRIVILPLTLQQIRSSQQLALYMPELKALQQRYKNNRQKLQEEQMKFFREHKINPAASCLPILPQLPIFFSLFYVLRGLEEEVIEPRYPGSSLEFLNGLVPSISDNVKEHWSGYLLLVIYVVSQWGATLLVPMSPTADPRQARLMKGVFFVLPLFAIPFVINFPTGLMVYWVTTNVWTAAQGVVTRRLIPRPELAPPKRSSRAAPKDEEPPGEGDDGAGDGAKRKRPAPRPAAPARASSGGQAQVRRRKKRGQRPRR